MSKKKCTDGRRNNIPPEDTQFKPGQSGNLKGRPSKKSTTFMDDIKNVFGKECEFTVNGEKKVANFRTVILERVAVGAANGDPKMIKLAMPYLKVMDDAPEFEILPEDRAIMAEFEKYFNDKGELNDGD